MDEINELKLKNANAGVDPTDCEGMLGYESEGQGDGL